MDIKLNFLSDNVNGLKSSKKKKELKCLNTLGTKSPITESYFYRKRILQKMYIRNGEMIFKGK